MITNTCTACGEVKTEKLPATGQHDLTYTDNENGATHSVSCGNSGKVLNADEQHTFVDRICTKCDAKEVCEHVWDDGVVILAATCCATGEKHHTCTNCGEQYIEILPVDSDAHTGVNHMENAKEATCVEAGYTGDTVCECGAIMAAGEEIAKKAHRHQAYVTAPTCTEGGYTIYICADCGDSYVTDQTEPLGHNWDDGVVTKEPTETTEGERTHTCTNCGETKTEVIDKIAPAVTLGDVNGDGKINARDARLLLRYAAGLIGDDELDLSAADYNGDGKVNARDARALLRYAAGLN